MLTNLKRLLAVGTAAAVALVGYVPAPAVAQAPAVHPVAVSAPAPKAANWLAVNPATVDDGFSGQISNALGLAVLDTKATRDELRERVAVLRAEAATKTAGQVGAAANLAILVRILKLDPENFGGADLIRTILAAKKTDGQIGDFGSAYAQALAIIALHRSGKAVPEEIVSKLLSFQAKDGINAGAFGYEWDGFVADPDSTGLALQALKLVKGDKAVIANAVNWAKANQNAEGYWTFYSPVDSTALMATALKQVHPSGWAKVYTKARTWLRSQQLANGGFPASLSGTDANLLATSNAAFLIAGESLATARYDLKPFKKSPRPVVAGARKVGQTLTANTRTWSPAAEFSYQWYRNGRAIAGATASTYLLTAADKGKKIRVRVLASAIGMKPDYERSKATGKIKKG